MTNEDKYKLKIFQMHLRRLTKFTKPLYKKSGYTVNYTAKNSTLKTSNLATELRMAAIINEIRSFMLRKDPSQFEAIADIALKFYRNDQEKVLKIRKWKKQWKELFLQSTGIVINVEDKEIFKNWGEVLDALTYGKFIHNKKEKYATYAHTEIDPMLTGHVALTFSSIAVNVDKYLRTFDHHFVKPILESSND
jgi:hypothetical protein